MYDIDVIGMRVIVMLRKCLQLKGCFNTQQFMIIFCAILHPTYGSE